MKAVRLYHLRREAQPRFLQIRKDIWVAADSPKLALAHGLAELGETRGTVTVYDYGSGPPGIVALGDADCICATYSEADQRQVSKEHPELIFRLSRYLP